MILCGRDKTQKKTYMLSDVLEKFEAGIFDPNHPLQRRSGRWPKEYKSGLVTTVLRNEDFDPLKVCEQIFDDDYKLWLIDALQRVSTLLSYRNNEFSIRPDQCFSILYYKEEDTGKTIEYDIRRKYYNQLPKELQKRFDGYNVDVVEHLDCTNKEIAYHMVRYNSNTGMNTNEKNFTYMVNMAESIKNISKNNRFFADCGDYSESDKVKGAFERVIMESMMLLFHFDCWSKGKKMNIYLDENASDAEIGIFENELNRLTTIVDKDTTGKLFNIKNSFIWFGAFHKFTEFGMEDNRFAEFLKAFQNGLYLEKFPEYDNETFDTYEDKKGTKDKKVVAAKLDMIEKLMKKFFDLNYIEEPNKKDELNIELDNNSNKKPEKGISKSEKDIAEKENVSMNKKEKNPYITNDEILEFVKNHVDEETNLEDIADYKELIEAYYKVDCNVRLTGDAVMVALIAYAYKIEQDKKLTEWLNKVGKGERTYSSSNKINYMYLKRDFDEFLERENGGNKAA